MPNVDYTLPDYDEMLRQWTLVGDCMKGQDAVKDKRTIYLPTPEAMRLAKAEVCGDVETVAAIGKRYEQYLQRAVFYNVVQRTHAGMVGQVFAKEPTLELPSLLGSFEQDVDGAGVAIDQQAKATLGKVLADGRAGLYVDYPRTERTATRQELLDGQIRPTIIQYDPEQIINWRTTTIGALKLLSLVVMRESVVVDDDGFEPEFADQYRALRLIDSTYTVEVYDENGDLTDAYTPTDSAGRAFSFIPFTFVGSENNDTDIDLPPMYDMSVLNIGHYRNSADYEESCFMVGQPTPVLSGMTQQWVEDVLKGEVHLGSRAAIPLPEGGNAMLLQADPNQMPLEAMRLKQEQMVALGAKLVETQVRERTATEAQQDNASETSVLASVARNVSEAYTQCIEWAGQFVGATVGELQLNTEFSLGRLTPEDRKMALMEWQAGSVTTEEYRRNLIDAGIAYEDLEAYKDQVEMRPDADLA